MGTEGVFGYSDIQGTKPTKVAHKMHLVTPRMDVDVTGVSFKHVRTQIFDHPRDEGLKHREQLWNYQQRYRGAGKLKSITTSAVSSNDDQNAEEYDDNKEDENARTSANRNSMTADKISVQSHFRRRLSNKIRIASLRHSDLYLDTPTRSQAGERKEEERMAHPGIQRLYSSGLIVKNTLYKQLRQNDSGDERRTSQPGDNSQILEAIEKFGSLERLPDISFPHVETPAHHHSLRSLKSLSSYSRRFLDQGSYERRITPLQRAQTITDASRPAMKRIFFLGKRNNHRETILRMNCIGTTNDDGDDGDDEDEDDDDDDDDDDDEIDEDYDDEWDDGIRLNGTSKLRSRSFEDNHPEHIAIRSNVTSVNTQDDMALIQAKQSPIDGIINNFRQEKTFHVNSGSSNQVIPKPSYSNPKPMNNKVYKDFISAATVNNPKVPNQSNTAYKDTSSKNTSTNSNSNTESSKEKDNKPVSKEKEERRGRRSRVKCTSRKEKSNQVVNATTEDRDKDTKDIAGKDESDECIDIPKERVGHTTHSIERKLSIRKPWEWKPSPFRWIDRAYVRESDKPYIERLLNRGEIIDEYNYDSYARTKPLKVQNFPEHAGYKDRYGVMR